MAEVQELDSILSGGNRAFLEALLEKYQRDPASIDPQWAAMFDRISDGAEKLTNGNGSLENGGRPSWERSDWPQSVNGELTAALDPGQPDPIAPASKQAPSGISEDQVRAATIDSLRALMMIRAYRVRGHLHAKLDPLGLADRPEHPELDPATYGFEEADLDRPIYLDHVLGLEFGTVREIQAILERTYCGSLGIEFMHIAEPEEKSWLQERMEGAEKEITFTENGKRAIMEKLIEAETFEKFLNVKYTGTKRFGLDGGEAVVPALEQIIKRGGALGVKDIVFGMPHRGRLNVLANVMLKPYRAIFHEFKGGSYKPDEVEGSGDVKYHLGSSADREFDGNNVHLSLTANPSHLEAVNPVVLGKVRAKQDQLGDRERDQVMGVLLHGDAAFSGQGVVAECFALSQLKGYRTGGTVHVIVNNQIGFTTSPMYSRSTPYPSDVAKGVQAPIFHVNGDDPEAVVHAAKVATEFRQKFKKDVVIDVFCYRRFGHNESDEPMFTQPLMYDRIKSHRTTREIYAEQLESEGTLKPGEADDMLQAFRDKLEVEFEAGDAYKPNKADWLEGKWEGFKQAEGTVRRGQTEEDEDTLRRLIEVLTTVPDGFNLHRTLGRFMDRRRSVLESGEGIDWATGEALAFGSLLDEGYGVRLSGQDSGRGTFSQRHAHVTDQKTGGRYVPLNSLSDKARFEVIDSALSEFAVLGFDYGYSMAEPNTLTLWEAQFGDFVNGAQVIIDQFISSAELKWLRMSGLVMLLPHGYEGQGPEHSSARLERFLQMCAEDNWQVAYPSTPANYFHLLRRQLHREFRKPLVVMTPKSLLRHKLCVSSLEEMARGTSFHRVLHDRAQSDPDGDFSLNADKDIKRVVICTGKVYYDLHEARDAAGKTDTYILRLEQIYPFPVAALEEELKRFPDAEIIWCQEEPKNMGAWTFVEPRIEDLLLAMKHKVSQRAAYAGRAEAASPATGLLKNHNAQQKALVDAALGLS